MGHLFLINDSFDLKKVPIHEQDAKFIDFCKAMNLVMLRSYNLYGTDDIFTVQFSYGNVFNDFFYQSWQVINSKDDLKGISSTSLNLFQNIMFAVPSMINTIGSREEFVEKFASQHIGNAGIRLGGSMPEPYISCESTWHLWDCNWICNNQHLINWKGVTEPPILPNKKISDLILYNEIIIHNKETELKEKHDNNVGLAFHDEVMKHKGSEIAAYTIEVGKKIAAANYYNFEEKLSKDEQARAHSFRNIFSVVSRDGVLQYISLDHAHGMFEFHNHLGAHQGEYKFDGSYNSKAEVSHDFKTM